MKNEHNISELCWSCTKPRKWAVKYLCVRGIDFASFCDFGIGIWNCSDSGIFCFPFYYLRSRSREVPLKTNWEAFSNMTSPGSIFTPCSCYEIVTGNQPDEFLNFIIQLLMNKIHTMKKIRVLRNIHI